MTAETIPVEYAASRQIYVEDFLSITDTSMRPGDTMERGGCKFVVSPHDIDYKATPGAQALDKAVPGELPLPWLPQAEGIAFGLDGKSLLIGSEQRPSPLLRFRIVH